MKLTTRRRTARTIPFGWDVDPEDPDYLIRNEEQYEAIEQAREYLENGAAWVSVVDWLVTATGRDISRTGLRKVFERGY